MHLCLCVYKIQFKIILSFTVKLINNGVKTKSFISITMIALIIYNPNPVLIKNAILFIYINVFRKAWQEDKIIVLNKIY
jgi:hypothetical protein